MFSRDIAIVEILPSSAALPARGSNHPAFVDMLFLWGRTLEEDSRYREVVLPSGFVVVSAGEDRYEVRDMNGFVRAVAMIPADRPRIPAISPVKRFGLGSEQTGQEYKGVVYDWGSAIYRTKLLPTENAAVSEAKEWLDVNKPRWDSYTAAVNFERHP